MFLLIACVNKNVAYICGDHVCKNNKEKESYFKETMIIEIKETNKKEKKETSEMKIITDQALINKNKKKTKNVQKKKKQVIDTKSITKKKNAKIPTASSKNKVVLDADILILDANLENFEDYVSRIKNKNLQRSYPNINDIPN